MNFYSDIMVGVVVYIILFFVLFKKWEPEEISNTLTIWKILLLSLLLVTHVYAFYNYVTYPGLGNDSRYYDFFANTLSRNILDGHFSTSLRLDVARCYRDYAIHDLYITHLPYGYVVPLSFVYVVFGYNPFLGKILNIIFFYFASIQFYQLLVFYKKKYGRINLDAWKFLAFWPPLIASSVSFVKEPLLMLCYIVFLRGLLQHRLMMSIISGAIGILIRPYTFPIIFLTYVMTTITGISIRNRVLIIVVSVILFTVFSSVNFKYLNMNEYINETTYKTSSDTINTESFKVKGVAGAIKQTVTNPVYFIKSEVLAIYSLFLQLKPWKLQLKISSKYVNKGSINISGIAYWMHSFMMCFLMFKIIQYVFNYKYFQFSVLRFEIVLSVSLLVTITILRGMEVRYFLMSIYPLIVIFYSKTSLILSKRAPFPALATSVAIVGYTYYLNAF